jgi:DNA-binding NarL/FixJ family response regulator
LRFTNGTVKHVTFSPPRPAVILLIDGHDEDREYWVDRLNLWASEYVILQAHNGSTGLALCRSRQIDCVIVEIDLPDMSGFEVLIKLVPRARHPEIAVIMLSRTYLVPMAELARKNGAQECLFKSGVSGDQLVTAIRKAIAFVGPRKDYRRSTV